MALSSCCAKSPSPDPSSASTTLPATSAMLRVFVNGTYANNTTIYVQGGGNWVPQSVAVIEVHSTTLTSGQDQLVSVVAAYGAMDRLEFTAP